MERKKELLNFGLHMAKMMNKKGINAVVASMLLILIVIVAIAIIWFYLKPAVSETGDELSSAGNCVELVLNAEECKYVYTENTNLKTSQISLFVRRNAADVELKDIKFFFTDKDGKSHVFDSSGILNENVQLDMGETKLYGFSTIGENNYFIPKSVEIFAVIGEDNKICNSLSGIVECRETNVEPGCADFEQGGELNLFDFLNFTNTFNGNYLRADLNKDRLLNIFDYQAFTSGYDKGCNCPPEDTCSP